MLTPDTILERNSDLIHADIDNETMLMSLSNGEYYGMNSVGSVIWGLLENSISARQLVEKLSSEYEISEEQCEKDITPFLSTLQEKGIIVVKS